MQIRTKIAIQFSIIVAVILAVFSVAIYYISEDYRKDEFFLRLRDRAITTAKQWTVMSPRDRKNIKNINKTILAMLSAEKVLMFNEKNELVYASYDAETIFYSPDLLEQVRKQKKPIETTNVDNQQVGTVYTAADGLNYVVLVSANDTYGKGKLQQIKETLIISFIVGIILTIVLGVVFAGQSLKPIAEMNKEISNITAYNLRQKLKISNNRDELAQLGLNFNSMLQRLEDSFELQRSFVSNASHELRTPLAALKSELQVALESNRSNDEYKNIIQSSLTDTQRLIQLTNGLLQLAQSENKEKNVAMNSTRIDELLFEVQEEIISQHTDYQILIDFQGIPDDDKSVTVIGNLPLLKTVFTNLFDNACKYSEDHKAEVFISFDNKNCMVEVKDHGIGIPEEEQKKIFEPFYRTQNASAYRGHGIGLSVTRRIIDMHKGSISLKSKIGKGSSFEVILPHI